MTGTLWVLVFILFQITVSAQIQDINLKSNWNALGFTIPADLVLHSDTGVFFNWESNNGVDLDEMNAVLFSKSPFYILDTVNIWSSTPTTEWRNGSQVYSDNQFSAFVVMERDVSGSERMLLLDCRLGSIGDTLLELPYSMISHFFVGIVNDEYIVCRYSGDTSNLYKRIERFDLSGNLIYSKDYRYDNGTDQLIHAVRGIREHPFLDSTFILLGGRVESMIMDQRTLDTIRTYNVDTFNVVLTQLDGYTSIYPYHHYISDSCIISWGSTIRFTNFPFVPPVFDWQFYEFRQYWDESFAIRHFGPNDTDNSSYAAGMNEQLDIRVMAGPIPGDRGFMFGANKYRELLIYTFDEQMLLDSLRVYGNYNHVAGALDIDDNGDIYIAGGYSTAWTTQETYIFLLKIPGLITSVLRNEGLESRVYMFPNPTSDRLLLNDTQNQLGKEYKIFDANGRLVQSAQYTFNGIDVENLSQGSYILTIGSGKKGFSGVFVKE